MKARRDYRLPHHGLLAAMSETMLAHCDVLYTALPPERKVLGERAREFVWLCVLIATDEAIASHHIAKFRQGAGTAGEIATAIRLTAWAVNAPPCTSIAEHGAQRLPDVPAADRSRADLASNAGSVALRIAVPAVAGVHAARRDGRPRPDGLALARGQRARGKRPALVEAVIVKQQPGGMGGEHAVMRQGVAMLRLHLGGDAAPSAASGSSGMASDPVLCDLNRQRDRG